MLIFMLTFIVKDIKTNNTSLSPNLPRNLFWFPPHLLQTRSVNIKVHDSKKRPIIEERRLVECWGGYEGLEVLKVLGFGDSFITSLSKKLTPPTSPSPGIINSFLPPPPPHHLSPTHSLTIGTSHCYPTTPDTQPQCLKGDRKTDVVQFLNLGGDSAVRLMSNGFECGVVEQPVTIFLVGIGMEDGCFMSGLKTRFELGHMYPHTSLESFLDRSRVKCCASATPMIGNKFRNLEVDGSSDSDSSSDSAESMMSASSLPPADEILSGQTRPGNWHLYTCIYDGEKSVVRVDGKVEAEGNVGEGGLDGVQLGSDHMFNLSLCDGGAGLNIGEAGGGAIAEVGAFNSVLSVEDIEIIENELMAKHGIARSTDLSLQEAEWGFHATALIHQNQPWKLEKKIPLRIAARERSVVWKKVEPVSGVKINVSRIGTNKFDSDSEW
ncbi:hypothetical protein TL16_g06117 [Triparma laevis f. inornata]|uniref:Uncharacterized protein n=1 Tax=Triparma laevis f. inornata TaxID=1714386 RepID=A0A9W7AJ23_9STRA|nr:hypothetical protein TL16_g06117 [Triparma laevis f. inornata]